MLPDNMPFVGGADQILVIAALLLALKRCKIENIDKLQRMVFNLPKSLPLAYLLRKKTRGNFFLQTDHPKALIEHGQVEP